MWPQKSQFLSIYIFAKCRSYRLATDKSNYEQKYPAIKAFFFPKEFNSWSINYRNGTLGRVTVSPDNLPADFWQLCWQAERMSCLWLTWMSSWTIGQEVGWLRVGEHMGLDLDCRLYLGTKYLNILDPKPLIFPRNYAFFFSSRILLGGWGSCYWGMNWDEYVGMLFNGIVD